MEWVSVVLDIAQPTYASKREKSNSNFQDHRSVNDDFKDVEWQPRASISQAQYHRRNRERCHSQIEKDICPRVHKSIGNPPQDFAAGEGIH